MPGVRALPEPELRLAGLERARSWLDPQMRNAVYGYLAEEDKQSIAAYMRQVVMPGMAQLMHRPAYDFAQVLWVQPLARRGRLLPLPSGRVRSSLVESSIRSAALAAGAVAFCLVAILNCGGYRYGVGDQAFYIPAVTQHLNPDLFPRDRAILHAQDRFMLYDDAIAAFVRASGVSVQTVFFAGYLAGLALLFGAIVAIGRVMYQTWLGVAMLAALLTLRHRITQTGANSLESYFQPRMMAFALGAWAIAAYLRGRIAAALGARGSCVRHSSDDGDVVRDLDRRGAVRVDSAHGACRSPHSRRSVWCSRPGR